MQSAGVVFSLSGEEYLIETGCDVGLMIISYPMHSQTVSRIHDAFGVICDKGGRRVHAPVFFTGYSAPFRYAGGADEEVCVLPGDRFTQTTLGRVD